MTETISPDLLNRILDLAVSIQQIPAPTFEEGERAAFIQQQFQTEGLNDVSMDSLGNVYGRLPGSGSAAPLVVCAHLDTVFPIHTDLTVSRSPELIAGPGIGDNSLGVAGLLGLLWILRHREITLPGDLWLVANVGEEGLGDLNGMRTVVDRFGSQPRAYLVLEGMTLGYIYHRGLGVRRYRITTNTEGGHAWGDYGNPSAIHELAALITHLAALSIPETPRTSLNVGVIQGGTSINTLAAQASLELDLRSVDVDELAGLTSLVLSLVQEANKEGVEVTAEVIGDRPAGEIPSDHSLVQLAVECLKAQGVEEVTLNIGSTDANIPLSRDLPAICIGLTQGGKPHTANEFINTAPLDQGMAQLAMLVERVFSGQ